ncbi:hypothetical protein [Kitasatospora purpeofusca]|uniref:Uncharacterized protein n=1 Tax=Kitasatospora purpeofusca TaxID=67352 RepID=A0ABZ1TT99_9ACTN|nr:hypothetical protein [Kitasatospora purpeofusca]
MAAASRERPRQHHRRPPPPLPRTDRPAIDGPEKALAGPALLDDTLAPDLRKPQDYFHRVRSTAFPAHDPSDAGTEEESEYSDTCTAEDTDPEQNLARTPFRPAPATVTDLGAVPPLRLTSGACPKDRVSP